MVRSFLKSFDLKYNNYCLKIINLLFCPFVIHIKIYVSYFISIKIIATHLLTGMLMGIAMRTGSPLSLNLAEPVWKQLTGMTLTPTDLTEVDKDYVAGKLL